MGAKYIGNLYESGQGLFCVDPADQFVARAIVEHGEYGQVQLNQLKMFCTPESSVLLLGAHLGALVVPLSKWVRQVTTFEANPDTYRLLSTNLKLNDCANVEAFNLAANDSAGTLKFVLNTVNSGGSKRMPVHPDQPYFHDNPRVADVPAVRLDDFLSGKQYDIIFMDIEGSEYFAMKGMPRLMAQARVVFSEFLPHHLSRVANVPVDQFIACFEGFETMVVPSIPSAFHAGDIGKVVTQMFNGNQGDEGLIFIREKVDVRFG